MISMKFNFQKSTSTSILRTSSDKSIIFGCGVAQNDKLITAGLNNGTRAPIRLNILLVGKQTNAN